MLRLVGVPLFLWLILTRQDGWAVVVLTISGVSDYLDGKIARHYNLVSRVGQLLDPLADRLYILATLLGLAWREIIPWWLVAILVSREGFGAALVMVVRSDRDRLELPRPSDRADRSAGPQSRVGGPSRRPHDHGEVMIKSHADQ